MPLTTEDLANRVNIDDWEPNLDPSEYADEARRYDTYGTDLAEVQAADPKHVWTCISCDTCDRCDEALQPDCDCTPLRIVAGLHYVNREYYIITKKPWVTGHEWE